MSTSGGTAGFPEGGFVRLRDSSNGFSAELNRQKKLEEERQRQKQAENEPPDPHPDAPKPAIIRCMGTNGAI